MDITEKEIKEMVAKTYTYLSTVLSGFLIARALIFIFMFIGGLSEYLEYHNDPDDHGGKLHYVDLNAMWLYGLMGIIFTVFSFFVLRYQFLKIRQLEKKVPVIIGTVILEIFSVLVWGLLWL
ncbi:MAG: hypothetical protein K2G14_07710 [Ruminococcus sp.]|nr:hypothetical protein [Ruminococcus sp.]